jgi:hypothetical protein
MKNLAEELRICNEAGQTLGRFFPERKTMSPYSDAELDARKGTRRANLGRNLTRSGKTMRFTIIAYVLTVWTY